MMVGLGVCLLLFTVWAVLQMRRDKAATPQETPQQYVARTATMVCTVPPTETDVIATALTPPNRIGDTKFGMLAIGRNDDPRWACSALTRMDAGIKKGDLVKIVELVYVRYHSYDYDRTHLPDVQLNEHVFLAEPLETSPSR